LIELAYKNRSVAKRKKGDFDGAKEDFSNARKARYDSIIPNARNSAYGDFQAKKEVINITSA